ncbi:MAG: tetratricopeptide repeat protein [Paludibacter sp.]|nr:tetratricopeptide repeat protein [Paludibacter sp.]
MENLKFLVIFIALFAINSLTSSQTANNQSIFNKSYEYEKSSNYAAAIKEMNSIYKSNEYFVNIRLGWLYYLNKDYSKSIEFYNRAINLKPYAIEARFGCVKPLSAIESWEKVKYHYLQILKIDPQNTIANYWLGVIYYNRKDFDNASKLFEKIINLYPLDYESVIMLGWTKLKMGKKSDAIILFNHALNLRPNDNSALDGLKQIK